MNRVVVDGATSMLGIALIEECIKNQVEVLAIVRSETKRIKNLPQSDLVRIVKCDLSEMKNWSDVHSIQQHYDIFYHFAWESTFREDRKDVYCQEPNIQYTFDAIQLAKKLGCKRFIGAGSQAEYGRADGVIGPDTAINPDVAYGVAKYAAGKMAMILCRKEGINCIWTRTFSVYGKGDNANTLVMYAIDKLLRREKPVFTKAEQNWDYLYAKDAGRAFFLIGDKGKAESVYCIGSGQTHPLREFILQIRDAIDPKLEIGIGELEYSPLQVMNLETDISALKEDVGFAPCYSFKQGIEETINWYKSTL